MLRVGRYVLILLGLMVGVYGAISDWDLLTLVGSFVVVVALIFPLLKTIFKK